MKSASGWCWAAHGKHPSIKDYFRIGRQFPLAFGFAEWTRKGYSALPEQDRSGKPGGCSWRFWARGKNGNILVCGLLRDSSDSSGRPYPLLIIGSGSLPSWQEHWELLPWVCEAAWHHMERVSAQHFDNLEELEKELLRTKPPCHEWPDIHSTGMETGSADSLSRFSIPLDQLRNDAVRLPLNDPKNNHDDMLELALRMNVAMKSKCDKAPGAMFMGGTLKQSFAMFFLRALNTDDFHTLWSPDSNKSEEC